MPTRNVNLTEEMDRYVLAKKKAGAMKMPARLYARRFAPWNARNRNTKPSWLVYVQRLTRETRVVLPAAACSPVSEKRANFPPRGIRKWLRFISRAAPKLIYAIYWNAVHQSSGHAWQGRLLKPV
jgi:hypothetical protein